MHMDTNGSACLFATWHLTDHRSTVPVDTRTRWLTRHTTRFSLPFQHAPLDCLAQASLRPIHDPDKRKTSPSRSSCQRLRPNPTLLSSKTKSFMMPLCSTFKLRHTNLPLRLEERR